MKRLLVLFSLLIVLAAGLALLGILASSGGSPLGAPEVVVWKVDGPLVEAAPPRLLPLPGYRPSLSMAEVYTALRQARTDRRVKGLAAYLEDPDFGLAKAQELRRQFALLRAAGKFVDCYLETAGEGSNGTLAYFLATACDDVRLAPAGEVNLLGLFAQGLFLRGALEKLHVEPDFHSVGAYKSAVETYTRKGWSAPAEEAISDLLDHDYGFLVAAVAARTGGSEEAARALIDGAPYTAEEAQTAGLVDALAYPDEFRDHLRERVGEEPQLVALRDYAARSRGVGKEIAVVFASGTIVRGGSGVDPWSDEVFLGSEEISALLDRLAGDDSVAAVVLRVDSPGGSALASDLILRAVERLAAAKPLVASLSDVAASGGYYIVAAAPAIVAEGATITGSIGVFGGKLVTGRFEEELLGVSRDSLKRGANADIYSSATPFSEEQAARIQALMERVYSTFVGHVARGRKMDSARVAAVAQGRIWSGAEAVDLGLVDEVGGLDRAIERAAGAAGLDPQASVHLAFYPRAEGFFDWLLEERRPRLPAEIQRLAQGLAGRRQRLLELPPEIAALAAPFSSQVTDSK
jgi:protease IV